MSTTLRRPAGLLARVALAAASLCLAVLAAEGGLRLWLRLHGTPYSAEATELALQRAVDPLAEFADPPDAQNPDPRRAPSPLHPYTGSESAHDTGRVLAAFEQGISQQHYVVVLVGGSVAANFYADVKGLLEEALERDPRLAGRNVRVLNYAHHTYKQPQQLMRIAYLMSIGYCPDAVIDLDGFNEIALAMGNWQEGLYPLYPYQTLWANLVSKVNNNSPAGLDLLAQSWSLRREAERVVERARAWHLCSSSLCGRYLLARLERLEEQRAKLFEARGALAVAGDRSKRPRQERGSDPPADWGQALELCARAWYESSLSISAMCAARSTFYLHVLQPTLFDAGSKPLSPSEKARCEAPSQWIDVVRAGYPLLRERGKELAQHGVCFLDASQVFAGETEELYFDHCHFNRTGQLLMVKAIADAFLARMPDPKRQ